MKYNHWMSPFKNWFLGQHTKHSCHNQADLEKEQHQRKRAYNAILLRVKRQTFFIFPPFERRKRKLPACTLNKIMFMPMCSKIRDTYIKLHENKFRRLIQKHAVLGLFLYSTRTFLRNWRILCATPLSKRLNDSKHGCSTNPLLRCSTQKRMLNLIALCLQNPSYYLLFRWNSSQMR